MDLLSKMLRIDPKERITAVEIINHPFLEGVMEDEKEGVSPKTGIGCFKRTF
jgi:serine/threonine protein kinase